MISIYKNIIYWKDPIESTRKLVELINTCSKVAKYNLPPKSKHHYQTEQKSQALFLHAVYYLRKKWKNIPFQIILPKMYLGIYVIKEMKDFCNKISIHRK